MSILVRCFDRRVKTFFVGAHFPRFSLGPVEPSWRPPSMILACGRATPFFSAARVACFSPWNFADGPPAAACAGIYMPRWRTQTSDPRSPTERALGVGPLRNGR